MKALRVYHTIKYLKAIQIISRITKKLKFVRRKKTNGKLSPTSSNYKNITLLPSSYVGDNQFVFLNDPDFITNWNDPNKSKLWLYNLHYFDDLNQDDYQDRDWLHIGLLDTWIEENPFMQGNGWEPYPLSLRIVNWIKWFLSTKIQPKQHWLDSLLQQVNALEQQLEYHLLGNHLFANAKALVFAGCYFDNSDAIRWLRKGFSILEAEVDEQILPDGGHFELSPMYHNIILTDMLDLYNLMSTFSNKLPIPDYWVDTIRNMFSWSSRMSHPDGGVSFFNDSAFGVAPILSSLIDYAYELDIFWNEMLELPTDVFNYCHLIDSGYISLSTLNYKAIIDVANVGPDYIPGHAHADTLSFELSIGGQRVIVNSGTSEYGLSQERLRQRKTSSHNTVVVNEKDSSEVWSAFRVAKRARAKNLKVLNYNDSIDVTCSHDGYQRICKDLIHTRSWSFHPNMVTVLDEVSGQASSCQAHYHLHPEVSVDFISKNEVGLTLANGVQLKLVSDHSIKIQDTTWHPEFGRAIASKKLIITFDKTVTTRIFW